MNHLKVWLKPLEIIRMVTENLLNRGRNRGTVNRSKVVSFCYPMAALVIGRQTRSHGSQVISMHPFHG